LNALAAAAVGANAGLTLAEIKAGIECFRPSGMRMDIFRIKSGATVINDTYNANPASVKAALDVLNHAEGEKICVLGDMLELGKFAEDMHYETGRYAAKLNMDSILTFGEKSRLIHEGALSMIASFNSTSSARHFEDKEELKDYLRAQAAKDTTILIKASRGMKFEEITAQLQ
ncbi:MAG: UDP-N-acetylmuramoyl-tripeptide--D-alanyl-D-alanine ligase, partial [Clostridiales bacterium]|nr:UDP-N-acetylmuramoyl-tripeptide--D-alanyl-D-alanine ligase [Clostridiales bacterium]